MTHPTDKQAQDVVEGRAQMERHLLATAPERMDATVRRVRSPEWLAGATTKVVTLRPREIPFGDEPDAAWLGG